MGGLRLSRAGSRITAGDVWRAIEGPLAAGARVTRRRGDGAARAVQSLWAQVDRAVEREVDSVTLEELARRAREGSNAADFSI